MMNDKSLTKIDYGRIAFEAYGQSTGGLTWDKKPIPKWEDLPDHIRIAWTDAATEVRVAFMENAFEFLDRLIAENV